jgi:hypothetical protein
MINNISCQMLWNIDGGFVEGDISISASWLSKLSNLLLIVVALE